MSPKLVELEKRLKEAKDMLSKIGVNTGTGSDTATGGPSIASQIGFGKAEDDKKKDKKHDDEKEDKKLIAKEMDKHNEKKHGEAKDKDSAYKDMDIEKGENDFAGKKQMARDNAISSVRQPATSIHPQTGAKTLVTPDNQVKAKVDSAASKKGAAEEAAASRRMGYKKEGLLKSEEVIKFDNNGQWSLEKAYAGQAFNSEAVGSDKFRERKFDAGRAVDDEASKMHEMSAKNPISTFKPGQKGFKPKEKEFIPRASKKGVQVVSNKI